MDEKLVSMLRFIQSHNQNSNNHKTIFEDLVKTFSRPESQSGFYQLKNLGYIGGDSGNIIITELGATKLRELDEENEIKRRLSKNELDLIHKQKELIDTQLPIMKDQLANYKWFKWIPIIISGLALIASIVGIIMNIKSKY